MERGFICAMKLARCACTSRRERLVSHEAKIQALPNAVSSSHDAITHASPQAVGAYPFAPAANLLFLSGVGPRVAGSDGNDSSVPGLSLDHNGNFVEFDFEAQVHSVFANVKAILDANGSSWEELLDITVFLVHMNRDFPTFNRIYASTFRTQRPNLAALLSKSTACRRLSPLS